jgi:hypothetical protein
VGNLRTYTRATATRAFIEDIKIGQKITRIELPSIEKKTLGHWQNGVLGEVLPQNNLLIGMSGKKAVAQFVGRKLL